MECPVKFERLNRLTSSCSLQKVPVFIFIVIATFCTNFFCCGGVSGSTVSSSRFLPFSSRNYQPRRVSRQLGFGGEFGGGSYSLGGGGGGVGGDSYLQPYVQRQHSAEANFFQSMMTLNLDLTEVVAMYSNVTAVAETPACLGHCRTPIALWVVQSFYPCYSLKKLDCPKGLVCCMQDPTTRIPSANTLVHDTRIKSNEGRLPLTHDSQASSSIASNSNVGRFPPSPSSASASSQNQSQGQQQLVAPESTTLFDEEYFKNNFIQDEIPE